ncbi:MAG: hypothetical protein KAX63_02345 [Pseudomonas sp.]|nr:hypothetical protein [Pseudomonas sp.]
MAGLYPVAGSKIFIGSRVTAKGTVTAADFAGADWVEIDGWANAGTLGDTQDVGEQTLINQRRVRKFKTTLNGGTMESQFVPIANDPGQIRFKEAIEDCQPYQFKVEWGADCAPESVVTFTVKASEPTEVNWVGHGLLAGQPIVFSNTGGALPTGITAGSIYYVLASGLGADVFLIASTPGGTPIEASDAGSGTHTATAPPAGMTDMFFGLALPGARQGGDAAAVHLRVWSIAVDSNIVEV